MACKIGKSARAWLFASSSRAQACVDQGKHAVCELTVKDTKHAHIVVVYGTLPKLQQQRETVCISVQYKTASIQ